MIRTYCPICRTPFDVSSGLVGQKGLCSSCGAKFLITTPERETSHPDGSTTQPMNATATSSQSPSGQPSAGPGIFFATLITLLTGGLFAWLKFGTIPEILAPWLNFLGEMHPLFVHFPIGWIMGIFVLGILGAERNASAIKVLLWLNLLTCAAGIIAGQCFAADRADGVIMNRHMLTGLAVGVFSWLALVFFLVKEAKGTAADPWPYRICIFGAVASVTLAGHFGATLTHGEILDRLPWKVAEKKAQPKTTQSLSSGLPMEERTVLETVILPILEARCVSCHGAEKQKGELRLDSHEAMMAAGESEKPSFVAADPGKSESLIRIALPLEDEGHMPPSKKPQMEPAEVDVLKWWVLAGADPKLLLKDAPAPEDVKAKLQAIAKAPPQAPAVGAKPAE